MRILMTGATGLIGNEIGKELVKQGHEVIALVRDLKRAPQALHFQAKTIEMGSAIPEIDAVINLAGENLTAQRWTTEFKDKLRTSRIQFTRELVQAVKKTSTPQVWIQGSAVGYYGTSAEGETFTEQSPKGEGFLADLCQEWENACTESLSSSTRKVILRTGVVFSHRGGAFIKMAGPFLQGLGGVLGSGTQKLSLIHLHDLVQVVLLALKTEEVRGSYNLVATNPVTQRECTELVCKHLRVKAGPKAPAFVLKAIFGEMSSLLLDSQSVVSDRLAKIGFKYRYPDAESVISEVASWHQHPFKNDQSSFMFYGEQFIPKPAAELFTFFSEAKNLEEITPSMLNFKIVSMSTPQIQKNTEINYKLKVHGVPIKWTTDISVWDPPRLFVDNQRSGPYRVWVHEHRFEEVSGGTLMKDWVRFELPMGKIGALAGFHQVQKDIESIFKHRRQVIADRYFADRV